MPTPPIALVPIRRWPGILRGLAFAVGLAAVVFAIASASGVGGSTLWALVLGIAFMAGAMVGGGSAQGARDAGSGPWWSTYLPPRTVLAGFVAILALAMTWWVYGFKDATTAKEVMGTMVSLVTAVLGYLFGRGEAENASRVVEVGKSTAEDATQAAKKATTASRKALSILDALAQKAQHDHALMAHIKEAAGQVTTDERPPEDED